MVLNEKLLLKKKDFKLIRKIEYINFIIILTLISAHQVTHNLVDWAFQCHTFLFLRKFNVILGASYMRIVISSPMYVSLVDNYSCSSFLVSFDQKRKGKNIHKQFKYKLLLKLVLMTSNIERKSSHTIHENHNRYSGSIYF